MEKPIRILQMINSLHFGGSQSFVMNVYRNIDRNKIQFDFVVIPEEKKDLYEEVKNLGARIFVCPKYRIINHFEYVAWWNKFFQTHPEYEIIHGHVRSTSAIYLSIAKKHGLKTIAHSHSTSNGEGILGVIKTMMQYPTRNIADYLFSCSDIAGKWMYGENALLKTNYRMIPNGIDLQKFAYQPEKRYEVRQNLGIKDNEFVIGHIGRFTKPKNHIFLIQLFGRFLKQYPNSRLLLVGDGELWPIIQKECKKQQLGSKVIFTGAQSNPEDYYQAMDVFVFPSLWEGLPVSVVEAQASGLPCLLSDTITRNVELTPLVRYISLGDMKAWEKVLAECQTYSRKSCNQEYRKGLQSFDSRKVAEKLSTFYLKLAKGSKE
jgi:glycosyltransferase involved in cell wall biosynthesis